MSTAERMLSYLPPYYATDTVAQALCRAFGNEIDRFEAAIAAIRDALYPDRATLATGLLPMWEAVLGLTSVGTEDERRQALQAKMQAWVLGGSGAAWGQRVRALLGSATSWVASDYAVAVDYPPTELSSEEVIALLRVFTPAHIDINPTGAGVFEVGTSEVGDTL